MFQLSKILGVSNHPNITEEQKRILMIISNNNKFQYEMRLDSTIEQIERMIREYYDEKPVLDDLNKQGITVTTLEYFKLKGLDKLYYVDQSLYIKAIPILANWLKNHNLSYVVKSKIASVLIDRAVSKKYTFDLLIKLFKSIDRNNPEEKIFRSHFAAYLGTAFTQWIDDDYAKSVFELIEDKQIHEDKYRLSFLLESLANLKNPENRKKAIKILMRELQSSDATNMLLYTAITSLRKLKATEAESLIKSFISHENKDVKTDAKKALDFFDKFKKK